MSEIIFDLKDVSFSYLHRFPALCGIDMQIKKGTMVSIIGANGTGKSSLLQMLDGLIFPDAGSVKAFGKELNEAAFDDEKFSINFRKRVGFVFQNPEVQLFCPTVKEDIIFGPLQLGFSKGEIKKRLHAVTEELDIGGLLDRAPHQLSIGEKRKIAIASTLAIDPEVIILDEPTAGLDPLTSRHVIDIIVQANWLGKTIITATHDLHIVEEISDTMYVFNHNKKIARQGTPDEILADNTFLKENNLIHTHKHRHKDKVHTHSHLHTEHHS
ncbi:MAG: ABC transporter ATP-binding protein [Candidatus Omnitrophica bacterium]|nr:ABC transporter ATP-binding protein [Candidatus Omnitrophota bacterium]